MSDDTATVDVVQRLREYHAGETKYIATLAEAVDEIEDNRTLIEQQARTIAEQTKADEVHWKTRRSLLAKISELRLELLGAERVQEWTREDRIAAEKTIAEQAARLAECERDAGRYRYAKEHLRIGKMHYDSFGECNCEFDDIPEASIDAAIDGAKT